MQKLFILFITTVLAGCAGSSAIPLSQDMVQISARAAPICGAEKAQKIAFKQAAAETIERGYDRFIIVDGEYRHDIHVVGHTPVVADTTGYATATGFGNTATAFGSATTTYSGGEPIIAGSHRQGLIVKMFKDGDPAAANALSARTELGPKWKEIAASETLTCFD